MQRNTLTAPDAVDTSGYQRKSPRKKVLLRGKLICDEPFQSIDCTISDISVSGAGIRLFALQNVPERVYLIIMRDGFAHEAEVRWRSRSNLGLLFHRSFSLDREVPTEMQFLKNLWEGGDLRDNPEHAGSLTSVIMYKGIRISVVPADGGFVAYARHTNGPVNAGLNVGEKVTAEAHESVDRALAAAKKAVDTGTVPGVVTK